MSCDSFSTLGEFSQKSWILSQNCFALLEQFKEAASCQSVKPVVSNRCLRSCLRTAWIHIWALTWQSTFEWGPFLCVVCFSTHFSLPGMCQCWVLCAGISSSQHSSLWGIFWTNSMHVFYQKLSNLTLWIIQSMSRMSLCSNGSGRFLSWKLGLSGL